MIGRAGCVGILCAALSLSIAAAPAFSQQVGASVSPLSNGVFDPSMGVVSVPVECVAWTYIDPYGPMMEMDLSLSLYVNGERVSSAYRQEYAFGIELAVYTTVDVQQADIPMACIAEGTLGVMSASLTLPGRIPLDDRLDSEDPLESFGPGSYLLTRYYRIWDNFGHWFAFSGTPVNEQVWTIPNENGCNITGFRTGEAWLNNEARFKDEYGDGTRGSSPIAACLFEEYRNCVSLGGQLHAIGPSFFTHAIEWRCANVVVYR